MAKKELKRAFRNVEIDLEERKIYEFGKDEESFEEFSLDEILEDIANSGRIDLDINYKTTLESKDKE